MDKVLSLVYFVLILGAIVLVHEFGHYIFAKLFKVYVYEFSIGMGPKLFHFKKKGGETEYCIRMVPIGGFVSLAGEDADDNSKIDKDRKLYNKPVWQRFLIMVAGASFNFLFAFVLLFVIGLIYGSISNEPIVHTVTTGDPAYLAGVQVGDRIVSIDGKKVSSWSDVTLYIGTSKDKELLFVLEDANKKTREVTIKPILSKDENGQESYKVGIGRDITVRRGFLVSLSYAGETTVQLYKLMLETIKMLFVGEASVNDLSGPVGIYSIVDSQADLGLQGLLSLTAYLSMNIGVVNLIPFPAFDGGRVLFLIIEKIRRKPIKAKTEGIINTVGFGLLLLLMLYVTYNDVVRLIFK